MPIVSIPLLQDYQRPVVEIYENWALIDTGAVVPVFSLHPKQVKKEFHGELAKSSIPIGGIGGNSMGDVYRLPSFSIDRLVYAPFEVFVPRKPLLNFPFLLPATMFFGMDYTIKNSSHEFIVDTGEIPLSVPHEFKLLSLKGGLYPQIDGALIQEGGILLADPAVPSVFSFG